MEQFLHTINPDESGWVIIGCLMVVFFLGWIVTKYLALGVQLLEKIHGRIAVYGPTDYIRRLAWDAVRRLHTWNAARILLYPRSRTPEDSTFAAAGVIAQQATKQSEVILETASEDPVLSDSSKIIKAARVESKRIRMAKAGR